jgi:hypothetical protein
LSKPVYTVVLPVLSFDKNSRCFVAEILAPWQHCLSGHRVIIGTALQREKSDTAKRKTDAAKSKINNGKCFAPRHGTAQMRGALANETPEIHTYVKFCT